jgi:hypothetical protein
MVYRFGAASGPGPAPGVVSVTRLAKRRHCPPDSWIEQKYSVSMDRSMLLCLTAGVEVCRRQARRRRDGLEAWKAEALIFGFAITGIDTGTGTVAVVNGSITVP